VWRKGLALPGPGSRTRQSVRNAARAAPGLNGTRTPISAELRAGLL